MATVATTTNTTPLQFPSYAHIERAPDGTLYAMVKASTANQYDLYRSTNLGASWSLFLSTTRASISEMGPICLLRSGYNQLAWVYRTNESSQDRVYIRTISDLTAASPAWNTELLMSAVSNGGSGGSVYSGMDLMNHTVAGFLTFTIVAVGTVSAGSAGVSLHVAAGTTLANMVVDNGRISGVRQWTTDAGINARSTPSISIEHNGDDRTPYASNLWVTGGNRSVRLAKLAWTGSGWVSPSNLVTMASGFSASLSWVTSRWDKERLIAVVPYNSDKTRPAVYERNRSNTVTEERLGPAHTAGVLRAVSLSYDPTTGNARVFGVGTSNNDLYFVDYIRGTNSWTTWATVSTTDILGGFDNWATRRGAYGNARYDVVTAHSGAPNTIVHTAQTLSYTPNAPAWTTSGLPYEHGGAADVAASLTLDWVFSDADPTDVQTAYALSRQIGAGALAYWRASDSTWQATEQKNLTATTQLVLSAAWALDADSPYTFRVKAWDSADLPSAYSSGLTVIPSAKANPTLTNPTAGATITADTITPTWTVSQQSAYRVRLLIAGVQLHDSGWRNGSALTYAVPYKLTDGFSYTLELTTKNTEGLSSNVVSNSFTVDFIEPAIPTLVVAASPTQGWIAVTITNPTPSGGQPAVSHQDLYRRPAGITGQDVLVAPGIASGAAFNDWRAVHGTSYEYRSIVTGVNGTSASSAWTA